MAGELITREWHVEWRGRLFGWPLTQTTIANLTGWLELAPARTTNTDRPGRHGAFAGTQFLGARTIELTIQFLQADPGALVDLRRAFAVTDEEPVEEPLVIWAGTLAPEMVMARIEKVAIPTDREFSLGNHRATILWTATSSMRYSPTLQSQTLSTVAVEGSGLGWPLAWPLDWGTAGGGSGQFQITNEGNALAWPTFYIAGASSPAPGGFIITQTNTGQRLRFAEDFVLNAGEVLVIDTDNRYVSMQGVSRDSTLIERGWFGLAPNQITPIGFVATTPNPAATLTVEWRHTSSL